jgi:hypothetical protein
MSLLWRCCHLAAIAFGKKNLTTLFLQWGVAAQFFVSPFGGFIFATKKKADPEG